MKVKKSVVKSAQGSGTWKNKEGKEFYKYEIVMENGDSGEYSSISDSQEKFITGVETQYNYIGGDFPKIKPYYSNPMNNSGNNYSINYNNSEGKQIARSVGIKAATELGIAQGLELAQILETAKIMSDFILTEKEVETKENNSESMPF